MCYDGPYFAIFNFFKLMVTGNSAENDGFFPETDQY